MKILITGNKGYVGEHLERHLERFVQSRGYELAGFDLRSDTYPKGTYPIPMPNIWKYVLRDVDVVVHLGAISDSQYDRPDIFHWNSQLTKDMVSQLKHNQRIVFFSSCMAMMPTTFYGWSKNFAEDTIRLRHQNHIILRPCNIYGGYERQNRSSVPMQLVNNELAQIFSDIERDYIHIEDVCELTHDAICGDAVGTFYMGTTIATRPSELAKIVFDASGWHEVDPITVESKDHLSQLVTQRLVADPANNWWNGYKHKHDVREWCRNMCGGDNERIK